MPTVGRLSCRHARGEYTDDYQKCLDCGREVMLIGGEWFEVEGWVRLHVSFFEDEPGDSPTEKVKP